MRNMRQRSHSRICIHMRVHETSDTQNSCAKVSKRKQRHVTGFLTHRDPPNRPYCARATSETEKLSRRLNPESEFDERKWSSQRVDIWLPRAIKRINVSKFVYLPLILLDPETDPAILHPLLLDVLKLAVRPIPITRGCIERSQSAHARRVYARYSIRFSIPRHARGK